MNLVKYFSIQCALIGVIILTNFYLGSYIGKPFTYTDLMAILIEFTILILALTLFDKLKKHLKTIPVFSKVDLSQ